MEIGEMDDGPKSEFTSSTITKPRGRAYVKSVSKPVPKVCDDLSLRTFKVVIIGEMNVGKTCLTCRLCGGKFPNKTEATIGVDFMEKIVSVEGESVKVDSTNPALFYLPCQTSFTRFQVMVFRFIIGVYPSTQTMKFSLRYLAFTLPRSLGCKASQPAEQFELKTTCLHMHLCQMDFVLVIYMRPLFKQNRFSENYPISEENRWKNFESVTLVCCSL